MTPSTMTDLHVACAPAPARPWLWTLAPRTAQRLAPASHARWLVVECGRVWLTRSSPATASEDDVWLAAGERHLLPPGSEWIAEGWPEARWVVMEAPQPAAPRRAASIGAWLHGLQRRFSGGALAA